MNIPLSAAQPKEILDKETLAIRVIWLFHVSAMIGVTLGFFDFFVPKTPLNLLVTLGLLIWIYPIDNLKKAGFTLLFFVSGMFVEWIGVHNDFLFGPYSYGVNMGPKLDGVPWLIGVNWAVLVLITGVIANYLLTNKIGRALLGAFLMVTFDFLMEKSAPVFDFWTFEGGIAPLQNYIAWFGIAAVLHVFFQWGRLTGSLRFSTHLYLCQFIFFTYFYGFNSL
ncbi:MAG: carotenoid biosynthesis protein [Bacteroidota bacterium]